jgi:radical SAM family uncharacterized protein/radical SAM-linked protein
VASDAHPYSELLGRVERPARYAGGEVGTRRKQWSSVEATVCLAFPDLYEIGMSHLGYKILYDILNNDSRTLAERCYAPWIDMEAELRARGLPLVSLESKQALRLFDVVGFSLQFELCYTNVLNMLDLGQIPLRSADRGDACPLVLAGGPTATHPEPLAPFIDAFVIGDGEAKATEVALTWARLTKARASRRDRLVAIARLGAVYVPSLYETRIDSRSSLCVVAPPLDGSVPFPVQRAVVDLSGYPFPSSTPTGGPEAIFDRLSIEVARGCTEGCRFCQAGMIYRPVRERDPEEILRTVAQSLESSGYDEVSLTALSTADVSCISPLISTLGQRLAKERISLAVSSLRAYGLAPGLLDELKRVRITGLTFAPEAGTQRMRDVVNKNVTEAQLHETAERVFSRGFGKAKLYFMIGLPTETDEDVVGIVESAARTVAAGHAAARGSSSRGIEVTVSVSTHVPKPHTPFQWAAMDTLNEIERKHELLRNHARRHRALKLRAHAGPASVLEGMFARGDRRLADVLERAFRNGARFDSWDEQLRVDVWEDAFNGCGLDGAVFLATLPVDSTLPWSHIDVGLEDGFLAREYRKAIANRLSPPCGKPLGAVVHASTLAEATADQRRLVCYDCGIACDLSRMRQERITFLKALPVASCESAGPIDGDPVQQPRSAPLPVFPAASHGPTTGTRYRFRYEKTHSVALLGHLDLVREIGRVLRRVGIRAAYTTGFHPKPDMTFGPALSLGVLSLDEYVDVALHVHLSPPELSSLCRQMTTASPLGLAFRGAVRLNPGDPPISKVIRGARYVIAFSADSLRGLLRPEDSPGPAAVDAALADRVTAIMSQASLPYWRKARGTEKLLELRGFLLRAEIAGASARRALAEIGVNPAQAIDVDCAISLHGGAKVAEIADLMAGSHADSVSYKAVRLELFGGDPGAKYSPLDVDRTRLSPAQDAARVEDIASRASRAGCGPASRSLV